MNKIVVVIVVAIVLAAIAYFAYPFVTSSISQTVDLEVAKMVDRENNNLPKEIEQGVVLEIIQNNSTNKELTFRYQFKVNVPKNRFGQIETRTNKRVLGDKNLTRALNNGIKIFHQYSNASGQVVLDFETTK